MLSVKILYIHYSPSGSAIKNLPAIQDLPWVGKIPRRRKRQSTPVFLLGKSHGKRSLVEYSP